MRDPNICLGLGTHCGNIILIGVNGDSLGIGVPSYALDLPLFDGSSEISGRACNIICLMPCRMLFGLKFSVNMHKVGTSQGIFSGPA